MAHIIAIGENPLADAQAKDAAEILVSAYPNHGWHVEVKQGVIIIKHIEVSGLRGLIGMLRKLSALSHDAKVRKQEIIRAAGELLERANLRRGPRTEDPVLTFELDDSKMRRYWHKPDHMKAVT